MSGSNENSRWFPVKKLMGSHNVLLGRHLSYQFLNSPRRLLHMMSYYKFAAKIIGNKKKVLDVGCGEGLGTWLLAAECGRAYGIDIDAEAVETGKRNWKGPGIRLDCGDFLSLNLRQHDAVVSFDVLEHVLPGNTDKFMRKITECLSADGVAVMGTPNITSDRYASPVTKAGHVNLYSGERLENQMKRYFTQVLMFGANDEVVHTGFQPMVHYLIAVGCRKRGECLLPKRPRP